MNLQQFLPQKICIGFTKVSQYEKKQGTLLPLNLMAGLMF